jgi:hypothetical protein
MPATVAGDSFITRSPTVEAVLDEHRALLGPDGPAYRHHVYRVLNVCRVLGAHGGDADEKVAIAAVFHDLGIWTERTFDYLAPSAALADGHLARIDRTAWRDEIRAMIAHHHQVRRYRGPHRLAETFRRADWADVTLGLRAAGVGHGLVRTLYRRWPDAGFHRRLLTLALARARRHPLSPLPMLRW